MLQKEANWHRPSWMMLQCTMYLPAGWLAPVHTGTFRSQYQTMGACQPLKSNVSWDETASIFYRFSNEQVKKGIPYCVTANIACLTSNVAGHIKLFLPLNTQGDLTSVMKEPPRFLSSNIHSDEMLWCFVKCSETFISLSAVSNKLWLILVIQNLTDWIRTGSQTDEKWEMRREKERQKIGQQREKKRVCWR